MHQAKTTVKHQEELEDRDSQQLKDKFTVHVISSSKFFGKHIRSISCGWDPLSTKKSCTVPYLEVEEVEQEELCNLGGLPAQLILSLKR